jgi:hypothetical protein
MTTTIREPLTLPEAQRIAESIVGTVEMEDITIDESRDLIALEKVIERGLDTFVQVGEALAQICDKKLYRIAHSTFADYCKTKWKMSDRRARQLMDAAEVTSTIAKSGTTVPKSERQARPLATLPPAQRVEVWEKAVAASPDGQPTAAEVKAAVEKVKPKATKAKRIRREGFMRATFTVDSEGVEIVSVERRGNSSAQGNSSATKVEMSFIHKYDIEIMAKRLKEKAGAIMTKAKEFEKAGSQPFREITEGTASKPDATKTALQWLTHYWMQASEDDRRMFDNFRAGLRGGT